MFIEAQSGKLINAEHLVSIELLDSEIWGFTADSKNILLGGFDTKDKAFEEFNHIKNQMEYFCCLITVGDQQ